MPAAAIPLEHTLILAGLLFICGMAGLTLRRNLLFMLMSLEVMLNAAALGLTSVDVFEPQPSSFLFPLLPGMSAGESHNTRPWCCISSAPGSTAPTPGWCSMPITPGG